MWRCNNSVGKKTNKKVELKLRIHKKELVYKSRTHLKGLQTSRDHQNVAVTEFIVNKLN